MATAADFSPRDLRAELLSLRASNAQLATALEQIVLALAGRGPFGAEELRAVACGVAQAAPLAARAAEPRARGTQEHEWRVLAEELQVYTGRLRALQTQLDGLRCVLLARGAAIRARQAHLQSLERWSASWQQTR